MSNWNGLLSAGAAAVIGGSLAAGCTAGVGSVAPPGPAGQHALQSLRGQLTGPTAVSPVFADGANHDVAIAVMKQLTSPAVPEVDVYRWAHTRWDALSQVTLDIGGSVAADSGATTPIATADITPSPVPDLVVTVHYNAGPATAVVSALGGRWHALTFHGGLAQDGTERFDVTVGADGSLRSRENNCVPDCADGHLVTTVYRFDSVTARLVAQTSR